MQMYVNLTEMSAVNYGTRSLSSIANSVDLRAYSQEDEISFAVVLILLVSGGFEERGGSQRRMKKGTWLCQ